MLDRRTNFTTIMINICFLLFIPWCTFAYENIALRKSAWQLHPYENPYLRDSMNASKAVDGLKTDLSSSGHQCTISANFKDQALWSVDLGSVLGIHHVTIYYRTDNVPWGPSYDYAVRFLGFSVYISNTTNIEDGVLCFKDNQHFTKYTIPPVLTLNCTHHGRYVIYYNNRTASNLPPDYSEYAYNELCEFEVYACQNMYCGPHCDLTCNGSCPNQRCYSERKDCLQKIGNRLENVDCENATMYVLIGGVLGVLSAVIHIVALVISHKRYYGKKDRSSNLVLQKSENPATNLSYESALNENIQGSSNQEVEPSLQKSDYYVEPKESQYNNSDETVYGNV